jgi:hydrogenase nickel incorporation protein HypA/HybF
MHEANFTEQIVQAILDELKKIPERGRPKRVKVNVGEMLHLNKESVLTHFQSLSKGTALEGLDLDLEEIPVRLACKDCGWKGSAEDHHLLFCSSCNSIAVEILSGRDVTIETIEVEAVPS